MTRTLLTFSVVAVALLLTAATCDFEPEPDPAAGVALTFTSATEPAPVDKNDEPVYLDLEEPLDLTGLSVALVDATFEFSADPPVRRAFLVLPGNDLSVEHEDCEYDPENEDVLCNFGEATNETVEVGGVVVVPRNRLLGTVCREECHPLLLTGAD